jgi:hypothetical protein
MAFRGGVQQQQSPGLLETKLLRAFLSIGMGVKLQVRLICFLHHFQSVQLFCTHPV